MPPEEPESPPAAEIRSPSELATRADLRTLRRWILVAGVWAVAATAVALIALLDTSGDNAQKTARGAADQAGSLERRQEQLDKRLDALDTQVEDLAPAGDVSRLQDRLARAEENAAAAKKDAKEASDKLTALGDRVGTLEDDSAGSDDTGAPDDGSNGSVPPP